MSAAEVYSSRLVTLLCSEKQGGWSKEEQEVNEAGTVEI